MYEINSHLGRMDSDVNWGTIGFFSLNSFNVDAEFFSVTLNNFSNLLSFEMAPNNLDFVVLTNWDVFYSIFLPKIFGQRRSHQFPSKMWRSSEMPFSLLLGWRTYMFVQLHLGSVTKKLVSVLFKSPRSSRYSKIGNWGDMLNMTPEQLDGKNFWGIEIYLFVTKYKSQMCFRKWIFKRKFTTYF